MLAFLNTGARTREHDVEVHAVDARRGVELHAQVDVLLDAEAEVAWRSVSQGTYHGPRSNGIGARSP
jgi:hypothetical protein